MSEHNHTSQDFNQQIQDAANTIQQELEKQLNLFGVSFSKTAAENATRAAEKFSQSKWSFLPKVKPTQGMERAASARYGTGIVQIVFGVLFGLSMLMAGVACLLASTATVLGAKTAAIVGIGLLILGAPFSYMFVLGQRNVKLSQRIRRYAKCFGDQAHLSLGMLTDMSHISLAQIERDMSKLMKNDWCSIWMIEELKTIYLTLEGYQKAKEDYKTSVASAPTPKQEKPTPASENNLLKGLYDFIKVLGSQAQIMQDADAVEELKRMQETCRDIYDWLKIHPESEPSMRRFTSYYMPTTLKLLHAYNDVQNQQGENAKTIRQDISRFLHTLNTAFDNLHDGLLSSVSLDISCEIDALQGMLAQDGLSQGGDFDKALHLE